VILGFSTGLESFSNPADIGAMYPFPDIDWLFVIAGIVLWLLWHVGQIGGESKENEQSRIACEELGLERVMYYGGSAIVPTDREWAEAARHGYPGAQGAVGPGGSATAAPGGERPPGGVPPAAPGH
jgi:hypothetical protein